MLLCTAVDLTLRFIVSGDRNDHLVATVLDYRALAETNALPSERLRGFIHALWVARLLTVEDFEQIESIIDLYEAKK